MLEDCSHRHSFDEITTPDHLRRMPEILVWPLAMGCYTNSTSQTMELRSSDYPKPDF